MKRGDLCIGIVTFPVSRNIPLSNLADVLSPLAAKELHIITGDAGYSFFARRGTIQAHVLKHKRTKTLFTRTINYVWTQLRISWKLIKLRTNVDLWIFFIGGEGLALPVITAKLLRKRIVIASAGSGVKVAQAQSDPLAIIATFLQSITNRLSDRIILYSERLIEEHGFQKHRTKISIAHKHFLDFDRFKVNKQFDERGNFIGFIGTLNKAKGVPNLLEAISKVLSSENKVKFLIGGDGELRGEVEEFSNSENLNRKVKYLGWIAHDELPKYLNELKLLVLPSYTEGLPNIMLEAMACGTPFLATPVGAIPDIIKDGETGFIMKNNSPECITENIVRALNHPKLEKIAQNARVLVEKEFTYEKAVDRYREILTSL